MPNQPTQLQARFLSRVSNYDQIVSLFDHLPAVYFFVKDDHGRFIRMNQALLDVLGIANEAEIVEKTDYDFFSPELADRYVAEDREVMSVGKTISQRVWLVPDRTGVLRWYVSTKTPLFSSAGKAVGIAGAMQDIEKSGAVLAPYQRMQKVIEYVTENYAKKIAVEKLARLAHLSVSQLNRQFKQIFQMTPNRYVMQVRINAACHMLARTELDQTQIANQTGFYDASHFVKQFRKLIGQTPQTYRQRFRHPEADNRFSTRVIYWISRVPKHPRSTNTYNQSQDPGPCTISPRIASKDQVFRNLTR